MSTPEQKVLEQALLLPEVERLSVAQRLLESVEPEVGRAWEEEIVRRIARIDAGTAAGRPWEEIKKDFDAQFGR